MVISFLHATFMKIGENDSAHQLSKFNFLIFFIDVMEGEGNKYLSTVFYKKTDSMPHTGLKCLNGGGGHFLFIQNFLFLQLYFFNCLQCTVIKCLLNFIYWTPQLPVGRGHQVSIKSLSYPPQSCH